MTFSVGLPILIRENPSRSISKAFDLPADEDDFLMVHNCGGSQPCLAYADDTAAADPPQLTRRDARSTANAILWSSVFFPPSIIVVSHVAVFDSNRLTDPLTLVRFFLKFGS